MKWRRWDVRDDTWIPMPLRLWLWKRMVRYLPVFVMKKRNTNVDIRKRQVSIYVYGNEGYILTHICEVRELMSCVYTLELLGYSYDISNSFLSN